VAKVQRLLEYLNGRRLKGSAPLQVSTSSSSSSSTTGEDGREGRREGGREGGKGAVMVSAHMPLPPVGPQSTRQEWLVLSCDKVSTLKVSSLSLPTHTIRCSSSTIPPSLPPFPASPQLLDAHRAFHLELNWLVCSAKNVRDFLSALLRKAAQVGREGRREGGWTGGFFH